MSRKSLLVSKSIGIFRNHAPWSSHILGSMGYTVNSQVEEEGWSDFEKVTPMQGPFKHSTQWGVHLLWPKVFSQKLSLSIPVPPKS